MSAAGGAEVTISSPVGIRGWMWGQPERVLQGVPARLLVLPAVGTTNETGETRTNMRPSFSRTLLGAIFVAAGALHFVSLDAYERIMPPYLPLHRELVYLSGALEIAGGLGLFSERIRPVAGIGLILLLLAVWPANVQMLLDARAAEEQTWWVALLGARLPLQVALMVWVWRASRPS